LSIDKIVYFQKDIAMNCYDNRFEGSPDAASLDAGAADYASGERIGLSADPVSVGRRLVAIYA
jgi:hypothetical protein